MLKDKKKEQLLQQYIETTKETKVETPPLEPSTTLEAPQKTPVKKPKKTLDKIAPLNKTKAKKLLLTLAKEKKNGIHEEKLKKLASILTKNTKSLTIEEITEIIRSFCELKHKDLNDFMIFTKEVFGSEKELTLLSLHSILNDLVSIGITVQRIDNENLTYALLNKINRVLTNPTDIATSVKILELLSSLGINKNLFNDYGLSTILFHLAFHHHSIEALQLLQKLQFHCQEFKCNDIPKSATKLIMLEDIPTTMVVLTTLVSLKFSKQNLYAITPTLLKILENIEQLPFLHHHNLPHLLWMYARLGFLEEEFSLPIKKSLENLLHSVLETLPLKDIALILWSFSVMNFTKNDELIISITPKCVKIFNEAKSLDDKSVNQLQQAKIWLELPLTQKTQQKILKSLETKAKPKSSETHKIVAAKLKELTKKYKCPTFKDEVTIEHCMTVDLCSEKAKWVVEVDGPDHTEAVDAFKNRQLKKLGYTVVRLSYLELGDLRDTARLEGLLIKKVITPLQSQQNPQRKVKFFQPACPKVATTPSKKRELRN
jgi:very-short-patch-repair endonuclease